MTMNIKKIPEEKSYVIEKEKGRELKLYDCDEKGKLEGVSVTGASLCADRIEVSEKIYKSLSDGDIIKLNISIKKTGKVDIERIFDGMPKY